MHPVFSSGKIDNNLSAVAGLKMNVPILFAVLKFGLKASDVGTRVQAALALDFMCKPTSKADVKVYMTLDILKRIQMCYAHTLILATKKNSKFPDAFNPRSRPVVALMDGDLVSCKLSIQQLGVSYSHLWNKFVQFDPTVAKNCT